MADSGSDLNRALLEAFFWCVARRRWRASRPAPPVG